MKRTTLVIASDFHLDAPFTGSRNPGYAHARRNDLRQAFSSTIDLAIHEKAHALFIAGDLYEHEYASAGTMDWVVRQLQRLAPVPVILIAGNHDPDVARSWYQKTDWPPHVTVLTKGNPLLEIEEQELRVMGYGLESSQDPAFRREMLPKAKSDFLNVVMLHGTLDMDFSGDRCHPISTEELTATGCQLAVLGHFHKMYVKKASIQGAPVILNPGSPEPMGFDEPGEHGATVVVWQPDSEAEFRFVPLAKRSVREVELDVSGDMAQDALTLAACSALEGGSPERDLIRLRLKGRVKSTPDTRKMEQALSEAWFHIRIVDETLPDFNLEALRADTGLRGVFLRNMEAGIHAAAHNGDEQLEEQMKRVLRFGLEALETGGVPDMTDGGMIG